MRVAKKGFSLIELMIAMAIMCIIAAIALALLMVDPRKSANEAAAIATVRTIISAERIYALTESPRGYAPVDHLVELKYLDETFTASEKSGYTYTFSTDGQQFSVVAKPQNDKTGRRSFYGDETGLIRWRPGSGGAGPEDPPIGAGAP